jgi:hypothetical protein
VVITNPSKKLLARLDVQRATVASAHAFTDKALDILGKFGG